LNIPRHTCNITHTHIYQKTERGREKGRGLCYIYIYVEREKGRGLCYLQGAMSHIYIYIEILREKREGGYVTYVYRYIYFYIYIERERGRERVRKRVKDR